jgi:hypothetical protein
VRGRRRERGRGRSRRLGWARGGAWRVSWLEMGFQWRLRVEGGVRGFVPVFKPPSDVRDLINQLERCLDEVTPRWQWREHGAWSGKGVVGG